jgi:hypothetical protein
MGSGSILMFGKHRGPLTGTSPKLVDLDHSGPFSIALLIDFGSRVYPDVGGTPGFGHGDLAKTHRLGPFLPVFYIITN